MSNVDKKEIKWNFYLNLQKYLYDFKSLSTKKYKNGTDNIGWEKIIEDDMESNLYWLKKIYITK